MKKLILLIAAAISLIACCECPTGNPVNTITEEEASDMRTLYLNNQYEFINSGLTDTFPGEPTDNTHITFELEDLKKYIYEMEQTAEDENYTNLGLRIFLAAKANAEGVPNTTLYMKTVGIPDSVSLPLPIRFDTLNFIPQGMVYNKGHMGGNPPD